MEGPGVVDQNIQTAERLQGKVHHACDLIRPRHVGGGVDGLGASLTLQPFNGVANLIRLAKAIDHNRRAGGGEGPGNTEAYPAG
jgi:hypothetical protein